MDLSSLMGGASPKQEEKPRMEYTAQAASPIVSGEVKLTIHENNLTAAALFGAAEIAYAEINALILADYILTIKADSGDYTFYRMGEWTQAFYDALCDAYNKAVLRSLFIQGSPVLSAQGDYRYQEKTGCDSGTASVHVYDNNVTLLPPDISARRVPLCFVSGMDRGDYQITLTLTTGESYTCAKLGYDTAPFADAVEAQIRKLREKALSAVRELDPSLSAAQASRIAGLMPQGAAAAMGQLAAIAPSFAAVMEARIAETRAAESYKAFKELTDPARIYVGFRKIKDTAEGLPGALGGLLGGGNPPAMPGSMGGTASTGKEEPEAPPPDACLLWMMAPSPDGRYAAIEFAEADTATFLYNTGGDYDGFAKQLNRALEAIGFRREIISMPEDALRKSSNADYRMAAKRTAALQFVRASFAGRIIHSSHEAWKRKLTELWNGAPAVPSQVCTAAPTLLE